MASSDLDELKLRIQVSDLIRSSGIELKKVGQNLMGKCPFHDDSTASLSVNGKMWNCFGCEAGGDVVDWLRLKEKLSFPQAKARLMELAGAPSNQLEKLPAGLTRSALLAQVTEHYRRGLRESKAAQAYLSERGLGSKELWDAFKIGYADGTLLQSLPQTGAIAEALSQIGVLNAKGREHLRGCIVVPLDHPDLETVNLYGRRIGPDSQIQHLYLPGPKRGVLNWPALKLSPKIWLTESILDALSLWTAGVREVSCLFGVSNIPSDLEHLMQRHQTREVVLALDGDRAGREAVQRLGTILTSKRLQCWDAPSPENSDPNQVLVEQGPSKLKELMSRPKPLDLAAPAPEEERFERLHDGFELRFGSTSYKVTPVAPFGSRLRITLRAKLGARFFLDTFDLYVNRYRTAAAVQLVKQLGLPRCEAEQHLSVILERCEEFADQAQLEAKREEDGETVQEMSEGERSDALEFLESPQLIERLLADSETMGFVGEQQGKLLTYLIGVSRKLPRPMSGIIRSQSGAGKSSLTELVVLLTPPEDVREYSRLSPQALSFMPKDHLRHTLVKIDERAGSEAADYQIRTLQSSHKLQQAVVVKDPVSGQLKTRFFEVYGPIAYLETTTNHQLNPENASRCFEIHMDESEEQTMRIHQCQRQLRAHRPNDRQLMMELVQKRHHNAQRLLEPVLVFIPYVDHLKFPSKWLRTRRDNERFLCLIEAVAFLHQHQRERGQTVEGTPYILATADDYRLAYELAGSVLSNSLHELNRDAQELLDLVRHYVEERGDPKEIVFTRKDLRHFTAWQDHRLRATVQELVEMEYLGVVSGSSGRAYLYRLLDGESRSLNPLHYLTTPDELEQILSEPTLQ
jgi:DNA primase catalytic core